MGAQKPFLEPCWCFCSSLDVGALQKGPRASRRLLALGPESSKDEPGANRLTPVFLPALLQYISNNLPPVHNPDVEKSEHGHIQPPLWIQPGVLLAEVAIQGILSVAIPQEAGLSAPKPGETPWVGSTEPFLPSSPGRSLGSAELLVAMINAQISVVGLMLPLCGALAPVPLLPITEGRGMDAGNEGRRQPGELPGAEEWPRAEEGALELNFLSLLWGWDLCCHLQGDAGCAAAGILMVWEASAGGSERPEPLPGCGSHILGSGSP